LGLSILQTIVLRHGGSISVESELGRGATFTVTLPVQGPSKQELAGHENDSDRR
jgi:two-component system C4-dicarboxylate transport sensor histidine kinase DctB